MGCRKNLTKLTLSERQAFVTAVLTLKESGGYDKYVDQHEGAMGHGHGGPAFFPWHREYLRRFEDELQAIDSSVNLPYWDWTVENLNAAGTQSLIWRDDFMGSPGDPSNGFAISGPFADWGLTRNAFDIFSAPGGGGDMGTWLGSKSYTTFRLIESPHGAAHGWCGGDVGDPEVSPRDPVFWLIHTNVDRLWADWTKLHTGDPDWIQYAPESDGPQGHNLHDTMWPWNGTKNPFGVAPWTVVPENRTPSDMLDHRAIDTRYDTVDPECQRVRGPVKRKEGEFTKHWSREFSKNRTKEIRDIGLPRKQLLDIDKPFAEHDVKAREGFDPTGPFIPEELRPDLVGGALDLEPDLIQLRDELRRRAQGPGGQF